MIDCRIVILLMIRRPPRCTRTDTPFPYTTLFRTGSARQFLHQVDVLLLRVVLAGARELGPGFVLGGGDEVEEAGLRAADVAFRALVVQGVQAQEGVVRSEERRVGKECVSTGRSRGSPDY